MKLIQTFTIRKLRVEESFNFLKLIAKETEKLPKENQEPAESGAAPVLTSAVAFFVSKKEAFDLALKSSVLLDSVPAVTDANNACDYAWSGINLYVKAMCYYPDGEKKKQAQKAQKIFAKYGNPTNSSQMHKSGVLHNLLQDLKKLDSDLRTALNLDPWIEDLDEKEKVFQTAIDARSREEMEREPQVGSIKQTRKEAEYAFKDLVEIVNALVKINGKEPYATFVDFTNVHINRLKTLLKTRQISDTDKTPDKKPEEDRPVIPDEEETPTNPEEEVKPDDTEGGESDRPVIPDEEEPGKDENGDDLPEIE